MAGSRRSQEPAAGNESDGPVGTGSCIVHENNGLAPRARLIGQEGVRPVGMLTTNDGTGHFCREGQTMRADGYAAIHTDPDATSDRPNVSPPGVLLERA